MSEEQHKLCSNACEAYVRGRYDLCVDYLNELRECSKVDQRKRELNRALTIFAKSRWRHIDQFRASLSRIYPEEVVGDKCTGCTHHAVLFYNLAVLAFHGGHYKTCLQFLDSIHSFSTELAISSCILRIETCLLLCQAEKSLTSIEDLIALQEREELAEDRNFIGRLCEPWKAILFRAHSDYMNSSHPENVIKMLSERVSVETIGARSQLSVILENAFGCIYAKIGKPNLAAVYFQQAIRDVVNKDSVRSLFTFPQPWKWSLVENLGLSFLKAGRAQSAFDCLLAVIQIYNRNPRLWLRIAECCIMADREERCFRPWERRLMVKEVIGTGPHRKAVLTSDFTKSDASVDSSSGSGAIPVLSLEFASLCLRNAYVLLPALDPKELELAAKSLESGADVLEGRFQVFQATPGSPLSLIEVHRLRCSILCASSYVYLCLGETHLALNYAVRLKELPYLSPTHRLLCRLYAAEACVLSERWNMALEFLDPTAISALLSPELWMRPPPSTRALSTAFPWSLQNVHAITMLNLAVCFTLKKDYIRAATFLEKIISFKLEILRVKVLAGNYKTVLWSWNKMNPSIVHPVSDFHSHGRNLLPDLKYSNKYLCVADSEIKRRF